MVHSLTKFLGGHGNSIGGLIVDGGTFNWSRERRYPMLSEPRPEYNGIVLHETFGNFAFAIACRVLGLRDIGPALSPFNAFLILTGIETLPLRMQRHCDNTQAVTEWLAAHRKVAWVSYPGLPGDRYHNLAKKYCPNGSGSVFTFGLKGGYDAGVRLVSNVKLFSHLANIGDTRSLIIHPASTTHKQLTDEQKVPRAPGRTWCGSRSGWRIRPTSSATWNRVWRQPRDLPRRARVWRSDRQRNAPIHPRPPCGAGTRRLAPG